MASNTKAQDLTHGTWGEVAAFGSHVSWQLGVELLGLVEWECTKTGRWTGNRAIVVVSDAYSALEVGGQGPSLGIADRQAVRVQGDPKSIRGCSIPGRSHDEQDVKCMRSKVRRRE